MAVQMVAIYCGYHQRKPQNDGCSICYLYRYIYGNRLVGSTRCRKNENTSHRKRARKLSTSYPTADLFLLQEIKDSNITPREQQRYAQTGQAAFASLVLSHRGPQNMSPEQVQQATIPLPPIAWHPKAIEREENKAR